MAWALGPALAQGHRHGHGHSHGHHHHTKAPAKAPGHAHAHTDTEGLFAFLDGSDIGAAGERHLSVGIDGRFGKRDGIFEVFTPKAEFGYNFTDRLHVALEVWGDHFRIENNTDFADQNRWGGGVAIEFKAVLVKRGPSSPVGVALVVAPKYATSEEASGEPARHYGLEVKLIADAEVVKDKLFAAFNLLYEPERVRPDGGDWERESLFGLSAGLMARVLPVFYAGAELQYFRKYEGLFFETLRGHALYLGPSIMVKLGEHTALSAGWAFQVAGNNVGEAGPLDLVNFERHRGTVKFSTGF